MGHRATLREAFRSAVRVEFAFLTTEADFSGPEATARGLVFRGTGLTVEVSFYEVHEPEVVTTVHPVAPDGIPSRGTSLDDLYVAAGLGPAQDVPGSAPTRRAALKRVRQQAAALRRLLTDEGNKLTSRLR